MARLQLYQLRINEFKKIRNEVFCWAPNAADGGEDFHIIGVRDSVGKYIKSDRVSFPTTIAVFLGGISSIFEAIERKRECEHFRLHAAMQSIPRRHVFFCSIDSISMNFHLIQTIFWLLLGKSSLFEAFQFVFGSENIATDGNIVLTFHRNENQKLVDVIHFTHTRAGGQSTYFIERNNNVQVTRKIRINGGVVIFSRFYRL